MRGTLVDTNVWVAVIFEEHEFLNLANSFMLSSDAGNPALFCRATEDSWLRLATTPSLHRIYKTATLTNSDALAIQADWRSHPHVRCLDAEPEGTRELWLKLAAIPAASPKVWMDAYLAAIAIRAGLPFATFDAGFRRFEPAGLVGSLLPA